MWGRLKAVTATGLLAGGLAACSGSALSNLATLPVRTSPQDETPHGLAEPGAPLRGTAVAVDMAAI